MAKFGAENRLMTLGASQSVPSASRPAKIFSYLSNSVYGGKLKDLSLGWIQTSTTRVLRLFSVSLMSGMGE
jgi:hypothetical protein